MSITTLLEKRNSVRAYLETPVKQALLEAIFTQAQRAPSNCNVQPWQTCVVSGAKKESLKNDLLSAVMSGTPPNPDFNWLPKYEGIHRDRQFGSANALYSAIGVTREDKLGRQKAMIRNWSFFDAPHVAFFTMDKYLDIMGAVDLGIYAQTLSLIMAEHGLSNCMQGALGQFPDPIKKSLNLPEQRGVLFGMSFGYADITAPINKTHTDREDIASAVSFFK
ncbi:MULTISPECIES: nitroreductase [unclassified Colwellia]|jgi:nitroreductase|uniref:nitroreductase n=1 Tax=unclassified Colwellia TaxID=196834 RepID=UPI0015F4EEBB|nr:MULTISPECIES: nitroreductase [unclassified Colwellia]MBA6252283.1 nitroreductase [Colwellia sp. MB3u-55]MBA6398499.1 nitroreductase [Colwellia sp. BRX10-4]